MLRLEAFPREGDRPGAGREHELARERGRGVLEARWRPRADGGQVVDDCQAALVETASQVFTGGVAAAAVGCVLSALEHGLEYQRGEITRDEMYQRIGLAVAKSAAVGGAVAGVMAVVALAFPALIPLAAPLVMPLAILGLCTAGGKIVCLGKGWYELYQGVRNRQHPGVSPVELLPSSGGGV